jgi:two-component system sensor histidine kinase HydH
MAATETTTRAIRWWAVLVGLPVIMALALTITAAVSYHTVQTVSDSVARGDGHAIFHELRSLQAGERSVDEAILRQFVDSRRDTGLRCIAAAPKGRDDLLIVGDCLSSVEDLRSALDDRDQGRAEHIGKRIRMASPQPPPEIVEQLPFAMPPQLVIEYEPIRAHRLVRSARRGLGVGISASILLLGVAFIAVLQSRRAEAMRLRADRDRHLASLGEVAAVISHQIRNPLTSMKGHAQLLAETLDGDAPQRLRADRVVDDARRLEQLTHDLLEFVRSRQVRRIPTDPATLVRSACAALNDPRVRVDVGDLSGRWSLDGTKLEQALVNVVDNALSIADDPVEVVARVDGDDLVIRVRDNGPGIPAGAEERVFEPFHTTRVQGTGLGLAVARGIVEAHGGRIAARNCSEGGAEVELRLPGGGP